MDVINRPTKLRKAISRILLLLAIIGAAVTVSSCTDDPTYNERWYLSGTWQCMQYPNETLTFYMEGDGYWANNYTGETESFDYYCDGNYLYFQWYPDYGPWYSEDCYIYMTNSNAMQITYPSSSGYGPVTLYYTRL